MNPDSPTTPQVPSPSPAPKKSWVVWWTVGIVIALILIGLGVMQLLNNKGPSSLTKTDTNKTLLRVGDQLYQYPCNVLTEDIIASSFGLGEIETRIISEESALGPTNYPDQPADLARDRPLKAVMSECTLDLEPKGGTRKTFQMELQQFASADLAARQFATERAGSDHGDGYQALSDTIFLANYNENGAVKQYFAYGTTANLTLRLSHPPSDTTPIPPAAFKSAIEAMLQSTQREMAPSPKNFSKVVTLENAPFVDICPTVQVPSLASALDGVGIDRTAEAIRHYSTPVAESRNAPYATCTLAFANAGEPAGEYPHNLKLTLFLLPSADLAKERLNSTKARIATNAQTNTSISGITDITGLGDAAFKVRNSYNALSRQNEVNEYFVATSNYLLEIEITQTGPGTTIPGKPITDDTAKKLFNALQASSIDSANR